MQRREEREGEGEGERIAVINNILPFRKVDCPRMRGRAE